ncbi:MAG: glutamate racemase [Ignavibacteriaceae bacterium]|nr:glutamate racemase [Ignavibacteriaceae bacterium]
MEKEKPIGVFDSGIGGLTVVKRIASYLPQEDIVYFGDTARVPYGSKSNDTIIDYGLQDAKFLMHKNIKALVVACNTVSSIALDQLKSRFDIPIIGMIDPGARMASLHSKNKKIGVIGTRSTISNQAYSKKIKRNDPSLYVFERACPLFVPLAEEGWTKHKATYEIAEEYLLEFGKIGIDTLVLGCTHYPILAEVIQYVVGKDVKLIDSGIAAAESVKEELERYNLLTNKFAIGNQSFFVSDIPMKFKELAELFLGRPISEVQKIDVESLTG